MKQELRIVLVGAMGAGKSTIGRLLAASLSLPFKDTDQVIEEKTGADIAWIFDVEGEQGFRDRETSALKALMANKELVLATGGGVVLREENRQILQQAEIVVYLESDADQLIARTRKDKKRPLLQVENPHQKILQLLEERDSLYREVATHIITTDSGSPKLVVQTIVSLVKSAMAHS